MFLGFKKSNNNSNNSKTDDQKVITNNKSDQNTKSSTIKFTQGAGDDVFVSLIKNDKTLQDHEKTYIISKIEYLDHLDKFKFRRALITEVTEDIKQNYKIVRDKILKIEEQSKTNQNNLVNDITKNIAKSLQNPNQNKKYASISLLSKENLLGGSIPTPPQVKGKPLNQLLQFSSLDQLAILDKSHISFDIEENPSQILQIFFNRLAELFARLEDINAKRGYFRLFMRSPLFLCYLNTGITTLRHTEIQPRKIVLNLISQTDPTYLNQKQFEYTSTISTYLKAMVDI
jgi:hypothetical protein